MGGEIGEATVFIVGGVEVDSHWQRMDFDNGWILDLKNLVLQL